VFNKGETLHALRRHIVIGSRAQIPADKTTTAATPAMIYGAGGRDPQ
jgi:hypothetical protein